MTNTDPRIISITPAPSAPAPAPEPTPEVQEAIQTVPTAPTSAEIIAAGGAVDPRIYSVTTAEGEQVFNPANPEVQAAVAAGVPPPPTPEVIPLAEAPLPPELTYDPQDPAQVALAEQRAREETLRSQAETLRISAAQVAATGVAATEPSIQRMLAEAAAIESRLAAQPVSAAALLQQLQMQPTMLPSIAPTAAPPGRPPVDQAMALAFSVQDTLNAGRGALLVQAEQTPEGEWIVGYSPEVGFVSPQMQEQLRTSVSEFQRRLYPNTEIVEIEDGRFMIVAAAVAPTTITAGVQTFGEGGIQPTLGDAQRLYAGYTVSQLEELFGRDIPESAIGQVLVSDIPTEQIKVGTYTVSLTPTSMRETQDIDETTGVEAEDFTRLTPAPIVEGTGDRLIDVAGTQAALEAQGFKVKEIRDSQVILEKDILAETGGKEISLQLIPIGQRDLAGLERRPIEELTPSERERLARETALGIAAQEERFRLGVAMGGVAPGAVGKALTTLTLEEQRELGLKLKAAEYKAGLPGTLLAREESIQRLVEREATLEAIVRKTGLPEFVSGIERAFQQYKIQEVTAEEPIARISGRVMVTTGEVIAGTAETIGGLVTQTVPLAVTYGEERITQLQEIARATLIAPVAPKIAEEQLVKIREEEAARLGRMGEFGKTIGERGYEWIATVPTRPTEAAREVITTAGRLVLTGAILGGAMYLGGKVAGAIRTKAIAFQQARVATDISQTAYTGGIYAGAEFPRPFEYVSVRAVAAGQPIAPPTMFIAPTPTIAGPGIAAEAGRAVATGQLITPRGVYEVFVPRAQYTIGAGPAITYPVPTPLTVGPPITPTAIGPSYTYTTPTFGIPPSPLTTVPYTQVTGAPILPDISYVSPAGVVGRVYTPQALGYQPITPTTVTPTYSYTVAPFTYTDVGLITGKAIVTSPAGKQISQEIFGTTLARETARGEGIYRVTGQYIARGQPPTEFVQYVLKEPITLQQELGRMVIAEMPTYTIRDYGLTLTKAPGARGVISGVYFQEIPTGIAPSIIEAGGRRLYISPGFEYGQVATVTFGGGAIGAPGVPVPAIIEPVPVTPIVTPAGVTTIVPAPTEGGMQLAMLQQQRLVAPPSVTEAVLRGAIEAEARRAVIELTLQEIAAGYAIPSAESLAAAGAAAGITTAGIQALQIPAAVPVARRAPAIMAPLEVEEAISPIEEEVLAARIPRAVAIPILEARELVVTRERPIVAPVAAEIVSPAIRQRPIQRMAPLEQVIAERPITEQITRPAIAEQVAVRPAVSPILAERELVVQRVAEKAIITQRLIQQQVFRPITPTTTITTTTRVPPPIPPFLPPFPPPPILPTRAKVEPSKIEDAFAFERRIRRPTERRPRGIVSDLLSLQRSEIFYGKATSPSVLRRPEIFEYEERYPIGKVPTVEELEYGIIRKRIIDGKLKKTLKGFGKKLRRMRL